jgi:hypothetical protein
MYSYQLSVVVAALGMIILVFATPSFATASLSKRAKNFADTCQSVSLSGWTLKAQCMEKNAVLDNTGLDMNKCFTVTSGGSLQCNPQK